jgi:hypothetical protein
MVGVLNRDTEPWIDGWYLVKASFWAKLNVPVALEHDVSVL